MSAYPEKIQSILTKLNNGNDYTWGLHQFTTPQGCHLTNALCSSNKFDFISMYGSDAFLFTCDKNVWEVKYLGEPVFHVEPGMIADSVDFNSFLNELRCELPGVIVKHGSDSFNTGSEFVKHFKKQLERAVQNALDYCSR